MARAPSLHWNIHELITSSNNSIPHSIKVPDKLSARALKHICMACYGRRLSTLSLISRLSTTEKRQSVTFSIGYNLRTRKFPQFSQAWGTMSFFLNRVLKILLTYRPRCCTCSHLKSSWWSSFRSRSDFIGSWTFKRYSWNLVIKTCCSSSSIMLLNGKCVRYKTSLAVENSHLLSHDGVWWRLVSSSFVM